MMPMYAVVSLLDDTHSQQVERIWSDMARYYGVHGIYATPFPHFSYHVAAQYDLGKLEATLRRTVRRLQPFRVRTSGLGLFPGPSPVVYIPVVRDPALTRLHERLWPRVQNSATGSVPYYQPAQWIPHITLGHGDITAANLPAVVGHLAAQPCVWEVTVDNLAVISSTGAGDGFHLRIPFGAQTR
jgi:hypothetical protein